MNKCISLNLSIDDLYVYVLGTNLALLPSVVSVQRTDFTITGSVNATLALSSSFGYTYTTAGSQYNYLFTATALTGYHIIGLDMAGVPTTNWIKAFSDGGLLFCPSVDLPSFSLVDQNLMRVYQLVLYDSKPLFFSLNLNTGALVGSFYEANLGESNILITDFKFNQAQDTAYIAISHNNGFHIYKYYPGTFTFSTADK